jgi:DNA-binding NtrC family response regulator
MRAVRELAACVAGSSLPVLIVGESGETSEIGVCEDALGGASTSRDRAAGL